MKFHSNKRIKTGAQKGFSLVEIMVSISIFTVIITTGMGALLSITRSYQTSRERVAVINSMHFAVESMIRDLRIGDSYYASTFSPLTSFDNEYRNDDGVSSVLNFMGIPNRGHIQYTFDTATNATEYLTRYRDDGTTITNYPLLNDTGNIRITNALFRVLGSDPDDNIQPSVFIYLRGEDKTSGAPFVLQTFVSQRNLDI